VHTSWAHFFCEGINGRGGGKEQVLLRLGRERAAAVESQGKEFPERILPRYVGGRTHALRTSFISDLIRDKQQEGGKKTS